MKGLAVAAVCSVALLLSMFAFVAHAEDARYTPLVAARSHAADAQYVSNARRQLDAASAVPPYAAVQASQNYMGEAFNGTIRWVTIAKAFHNTTRSVAGVRIKLIWDKVEGMVGWCVLALPPAALSLVLSFAHTHCSQQALTAWAAKRLAHQYKSPAQTPHPLACCRIALWTPAPHL